MLQPVELVAVNDSAISYQCQQVETYFVSTVPFDPVLDEWLHLLEPRLLHCKLCLALEEGEGSGMGRWRAATHCRALAQSNGAPFQTVQLVQGPVDWQIRYEMVYIIIF